MDMLKFLFAVALFLVILPNHPAAQQGSPQFSEFIRGNKEFHSLLNLKAERVFRLTYPDCHDSVKLIRVEPSILVEPVIRPTVESADENETRLNGVPIFGQWIERVNVQGCGQTALINHLALAYQPDLPVLLPLVNGQTRLDPINQPFAEEAVAERLQKMDTPCDSRAFTMHSHITGYRDETGTKIVTDDKGYGWFEQWQVRACGEIHDAVIAILPDPDTRYRYIARLQ